MTTESNAGDQARKRKLLEAAFGVFARYGFRKTSMDEVARAAGVSRQGLYLHFATKEDLFREALQTILSDALEGVTEALARSDQPFEARLVGAFDAWTGRYVGLFGAGASDLVEASKEVVGTIVADYDERFVEAVTKAIRSSGLVAGYKGAGLSARQLADVLHATARGLKYLAASRQDFCERFGVAARAICAPLAGKS
ncbi:TetR/AcrR family transcriptional regulator [Vulgatibacter incomptus]|uniref:Transcriptional regulator, TetR family n=1 Tax=Vulgatibacter incomptus TaxID=1391653 RepID=A0A0K1PGQ7_9BACT|nr:TetR/AcrR family transcriptional regulator [Vulgatibacter incomptus]AKU92703.1 Transcriptional regulator, TetR family [Vulgatibacter incomptus]